jgi:hypothetical protein
MARLNALNILNSLVGLYDTSSRRTLEAKQFEQQKKRDDLNMRLRQRQLEKLDEEDAGPAETRTINVGSGKTENQTYRNGVWETDSVFDRFQPPKPPAAKPNYEVVTKNGVQHIIDMNDPANLGVFGVKNAPGGAVEGNKPSHFTAGVMNAASAWSKSGELNPTQIRDVVMAYGKQQEQKNINGQWVKGTPDEITKSMYRIAIKEGQRLGLPFAGGQPAAQPAAPPVDERAVDAPTALPIGGEVPLGAGSVMTPGGDESAPHQIGFGARTPEAPVQEVQQPQAKPQVPAFMQPADPAAFKKRSNPGVWRTEMGPEGEEIVIFEKPDKPPISRGALNFIRGEIEAIANMLAGGAPAGLEGYVDANWAGWIRQFELDRFYKPDPRANDVQGRIMGLGLAMQGLVTTEKGKYTENDVARTLRALVEYKAGNDKEALAQGLGRALNYINHTEDTYFGVPQ